LSPDKGLLSLNSFRLSEAHDRQAREPLLQFVLQSLMTAFKKPLLAFLHLGLILCAYFSPVWLDWRLILIGILLYSAQNIILGGCILTRAQFGSNEEGFYYHYLKKLGIRLNKRQTNLLVDYIIPVIIFSTAIVYQEVLGKPVFSPFH
jgi:hypothetical protein